MPDDVPNSFLLHKLRGTQGDVLNPAALGGIQMPSNDADPPMAVPLDTATVDMVEDWIAGGAPE